MQKKILCCFLRKYERVHISSKSMYIDYRAEICIYVRVEESNEK